MGEALQMVRGSGAASDEGGARRLDAFALGVEDACLWRELIDRLIERGESLGQAIVMADDVMHARHLRLHDGDTPSEPPPPSARSGDEEPLG
jgi:hypothetical protein